MAELDPRFKIRAPLRCDGIGRLDCAEDLESGMRMAVRWLPLDANGSAAVQACEKLPSHPTLPRIRQIGQMGTSAYVAMDFPDGSLLATRAGEALDSATLLGITGQIADALATIHSQGVFHGEMSADSILLVKAPSEKAFLWDMPLVIANRLTDRRGEERLMTQLVKTAPYLAPERAGGARATAEADVYALGAIVAIAGGASLPNCETTLGVIQAVIAGSWMPRIPATFPEPQRAMLERMLLRQPAQRPTAREVADLFLPPVASLPTLREMAAIVPAATQAAVDDRLTRPTAPELPVVHFPSPLIQSVLDAAAAIEAANVSSARELAQAQLNIVGIALTDNVSVSQELHAAGAALLTDAEAAQLSRGHRKVPMMMVAVMAVLVTVLAGLGIHLLRRDTSSGVASLARPINSLRPSPLIGKSMPMLRAVSAVGSDDELFPLTPRAKKTHRPPVSRTPQMAQESSPETAPQPAQNQGDFGFLEEEPELKRPTF